MALAPISDEGTKRSGLLVAAVDWIFGYDFFLSYNHGDGMRLPRRLKERLEQAGFRVFLDQTEYVAGEDLRRETHRQVVKSRKIVVVGRPGALKSVWVKREVDVALADGKIPVIIDVNGAVEAAPHDAALAIMARERHWLRLNEALDDPDSEPTDSAISELVRGFKHTRQEVKRQRILATAAAVLAVAAGVAIWQAVEATRARMVAEAQRDRAQRVLDQVTATANRRVQALSVHLQTQVRSESTGVPPPVHAPQVPGVATQPSLDKANALIAQGSALLEKGETGSAHSALTAALDVLAPGPHTRPEDGQQELARFNAYDRLADVAAKGHDFATEITALTNCVALAESQEGTDRAPFEGRQRLSVTHQKLGDALARQGKADEAERHYLKAIATLRELSRSSQLPSVRRGLAVALAELGNLKLSQSDTEAALASYKESLSILEQLTTSNPSSRDLRRDLSVSYQQITDALLSTNKPEEALIWTDKDLAISKQLVAANNGELSLQRDLASSHDRRGRALEALGRSVEALEEYGKGSSLLQAAIAVNQTQPNWHRDAAAMLESTGKLLAKTNQPDRAIQAFRRALSIREALAASFEELSWQREVEAAYRRAGELMLAMGREDEALETSEQYLLATSFAADRDNSKPERIGRALGTLCWSALNAKNFSRSLWAGRQAVELAPQLDWVRLNYAHALMFSGDRDGARAIYVAGMSLLPKDAEKWKNSILKDFDKLTQRRLVDSLMQEITALLGT